LNLPQVTYCEDFRVENRELHARRVIEGGYQLVKSQLPALVTVANSYHHLEYKNIRGARMVQDLVRDESLKAQYIQVIDLDMIGADPELCGLKGSPTIVAKTDKVGQLGGSCTMHQGHSVEAMTEQVILETNLLEFAAV